eukprot:scaffold44691_cov32-Tisochrysis_lutea.AAC.4
MRNAESEVRTSRTSRFGPEATDHAAGKEKAIDTGPAPGVAPFSSSRICPGLKRGLAMVPVRSTPVVARTLSSAFAPRPPFSRAPDA